MFDTKKFENIEDPEVKALVEQVRGFFFEKAEDFQKKITDKNIGMLKMLKMTKNFIEDTSREYKEKYGTDINDDSRKINDYLGINQKDVMEMLDIMKNFKK